jgi:hypothetical protein
MYDVILLIRTHRSVLTGDHSMSIYKENGFENRRAYLESLCEEYPRDAVYALAGVLGSNEDFDGLITTLEDEFNY